MIDRSALLDEVERLVRAAQRLIAKHDMIEDADPLYMLKEEIAALRSALSDTTTESNHDH